MIDRVIDRVLTLILLLALGAYATLIGAGHWGSDEYVIGAADQASGWHSAFGRILYWSPRPVSELIGGPYLQLCHLLQRPLVIPFLGLLWLGGVALMALAARRAGEMQPIRFAIVLLVLVLLLERPDEMFYWPMAAVAYLVGWVGLAAATLLRRSAATAGWALPAALLLAAWSVEMAASVVVADAVLSSLAAPAGTRRRVARASLLPGLAEALVCAAVYLGRIRGMTEVLDPGSLLAGHWLRCVAASVPLFMHQLLTVPGLALLPAVAVKLAILLALPTPSAGCAPARSRVVWAASLLFGAFLSIVLSLHQFGMPCCQRHQTMRQGMIVLALVSLAPTGRMA